MPTHIKTITQGRSPRWRQHFKKVKMLKMNMGVICMERYTRTLSKTYVIHSPAVLSGVIVSVPPVPLTRGIIAIKKQITTRIIEPNTTTYCEIFFAKTCSSGLAGILSDKYPSELKKFLEYRRIQIINGKMSIKIKP